MCEELRLERYDNSPWGFRLTGGLDFGTPLGIIKVTGGSIAELSGVQAGDLVKKINGTPTTHFTHLDAQNCIAAAGNYLTLSVLRGSVVTPPETPLRGVTPIFDRTTDIIENGHPSPNIMKSQIEDDIMSYYNRKNDMTDGFKSPAPVYQKTGEQAPLKKQRYSVNDEGQLLLGDKALSDIEIAELLTSNEEVLDQGVLGINFKKFLPKVDFIRNSEVFKMLQSENTKKEISEQAQLRKEPNKRFSAFLMKPKVPNKNDEGPKFVKFKPPRYLPKQPEKKFEWPKLKPWERPKRENPAHSVLWLFLEEKGEDVIDERWGTDEEERINMSRNSYIEYDHPSSISSTMRCHEDDTSSIASRDQIEHDNHITKEEMSSQTKEQVHISTSSEKHSDSKEEEADNRAICKTPKFKIETQIESIESLEYDITETLEENIKLEEYSSSSKQHVEHKETISNKLVQQLAEIQQQIESLENEAPSDLQSQLLAVKEQLSKIVNTKSQNESHKFKEQKKVSTVDSFDELVMNSDRTTERADVEHSFEIKLLKEGKSSASESTNHNYSMEMKDDFNESTIERREFMEEHSEQHFEVSTYQIEDLEETEYQLCIAPPPKPKRTPHSQKKPSAHPITPQTRPIILPGGRMWRKPKDAEHEEFYQGILVTQAEVLVGTNESVNFTKYMPPKMDMSSSEVYRLIHEVENKPADKNEESIKYCEPISKRHFYAATLREPPPIGVVEFCDL